MARRRGGRGGPRSFNRSEAARKGWITRRRGVRGSPQQRRDYARMLRRHRAELRFAGESAAGYPGSKASYYRQRARWFTKGHGISKRAYYGGAPPSQMARGRF